MLNFVRVKQVDYAPCKLEDASIYDKLPQGSWLLPSSVANGVIVYNVPSSLVPTADANAIRAARIVFSVPGQVDVKEASEATSLRGLVVLSTDQYIAADAGSMTMGAPLTLKLDADHFVKLGTLANPTDVVVAYVESGPNDNDDSNLKFRAVLN